MSMPLQAICFSSILSSWDASPALFFVRMVPAGASFAADGSTFISLSMITPALLSLRSCLTSPLLPPSPFCALRWLYYASLGISIRWPAHRQRTLLIALMLFTAAVLELGLRHHLTRPYRRAPTAKPKDSFKPLSANGLTPVPTRDPSSPNEPASSVASPLQLASASW